MGHCAKVADSTPDLRGAWDSAAAGIHIICVYVDVFDCEMVKRCGREVLRLTRQLPSSCQFAGKVKPDIFTKLGLDSGNDCKLDVTLCCFYSRSLSEGEGQKEMQRIRDDVAASQGGATAGAAAASGAAAPSGHAGC